MYLAINYDFGAAVGALAGGGLANLSGQFLGNIAAGKDPTSFCNYDFGSAVLSMGMAPVTGLSTAVVTRGQQGGALTAAEILSAQKAGILSGFAERVRSSRK